MKILIIALILPALAFAQKPLGNGGNGGGGTGGGGTIQVTANVLTGDGAGNAIGVNGVSSDCVHVDGNSAACSGGGASIPSVTNLISGNGSGNGADSGIAPSIVIVNTGTYLNPAWLTGLAAAKVSGLATVATSGVYADLTAKPTIPTVTGGPCTNQAVTAISGTAVPTCTTITSAYTDSSIIVSGGAYSDPAWITALAAAKVSGLATVATTGVYADLTAKPTIPTVTGGTCTNQAVTAISGAAVPTCTTLTSAYTDSSIAPTTSPALTTPTITTSAALTNSALGVTPAGGYTLTNATAAAAGAQQVSPPVTLTSQGWKTSAGGASQLIQFQIYGLPLQGVTVPSGSLVFTSAVNGAGALGLMSLNSLGATAVNTQCGLCIYNSGVSANTGFTSVTNTGLDVVVNGANALHVHSNALGFPSNFPVGFSSTTAAAGTVDTIFTRFAAATLQHGAADAAAPVAQTIRMQSVVAGTSNTAGASATIKGSTGTGTGVGGDILLQVARAGTTGTAQNTYVTALTLSGTSGAPVLPSVAFASLPVTPTVGTMVYCTDCVSGTFDATAAGSGTGTPVTYQNGAWKVK
jgi:hypothetical protein